MVEVPEQSPMDHRDNGSVPGSSWPHVKVSLDNTLKPSSGAIIHVQPLSKEFPNRRF